ncbi:hypothetical protein LMH87_003844 [Akanthomyces muscarius]|uniref:RING-type E3 ubiquitin transferase n=1 Tax=Akanthomyces muscarius TaxID=2231603 RepID=A0A9W8Q2P6_AKAMU|nr:hypothetical protein LMH87_003844 [Akanthomyces muscarius]KAJ4144979.1 hypothetical protein LMH87_003844 [Akanthomyces muscarius]
MATPRDPSAHTAASETRDDTTQPGASTSAAGQQATDDSVGLSAGRGETLDRNNEEDQPSPADDASSAPTRGPVAQTQAPTNEANSPALTPENEHQNTQNDTQNREHDISDNDQPAREEYPATDAESANAESTTIPIRTSSVRASSHAAAVQAAAGPSSNFRIEPSSRTQFIGPDGQVVDLATIIRSSLRQQYSHTRERPQRYRRESPEFVVPRWQPDVEVTLCPICNTQFSIWVRKHHCRKCGRVVCNSCSPHRITIPNQYIVRPPDSEVSFASSLFADPIGASYPEHDGMPGGERVRLCNPCVPDPNTAPPQSPTPGSPRSPHHRSRSSLNNAYGFGGLAGALQAANDSTQYNGSRTRSIALNPPARGHDPVPTSSRSASYQTPFERYMSARPGNAQFSTRPGLFEDGASSSRHRALPPTPQIAEEDECPVCHRELPATTLPDFEVLREQHITACIQSHSTYGSPAPGVGVAVAPPPVPRRSGMYTYTATEKDCVDDAECTICLEEFAVGVPMARLECLCRFHRACIAAWFVNHPGRCPVHQHDGFGF